MLVYERRRVLIWGKTAPELSTKYIETVCTGGVLEDGTPIRLHPIDFRYFNEDDRFKKYQWITARIAKNPSDPRPESYRVDCESIEIGDWIPTDDREWDARGEFVFKDPSWQFDSVDALTEAQATTKRSLGVVAPKEILSVELHARAQEENISFEQKKERLRKKLEAEREEVVLFDEWVPPEMKELEFVKNRIQIRWVCGAGNPHTMQIMDWEAVELQRKTNDDKALQRVKDHLDLTKYATKFFLGNLRMHPTRFTIVGLWYPRKPKVSPQGLLF